MWPPLKRTTLPYLRKVGWEAETKKLDGRAQAIHSKHAQENPPILVLPIPPPPHELPGVSPSR